MTDEQRAKYTQKEVDALGAKGQALKSADGSYSYPVADLEDLKRAIRAVGRGDADHDGIRKYVVGRAKALGHSDLIPDNWNADGSLKSEANSWTPGEQRDTAMDVFAALDGAVTDNCEGMYSSWSVWVQDWYGSGSTEDPYTVVYCAGGDLYAAPFEFDEQNKVTVGEGVKVRPVTSYVERTHSPVLEWRRKKAELLRGLEHREFSTSDLEIREAEDGESWKLTGYASVTETPYDVGFYTETIKRGAFKRTLSENPDVQLLVNHEGLPLARTRSNTLRLEEREGGLWVEADLDRQDPDAQRLQRKMARGDIDQMSFAFQVTQQDWNDDYSERTIKGVSIHRGDVSVVNQGANSTSTATIRSTEALAALRHVGLAGVFDALKECRAGKTLSAATTEVLTRVLELVANADDAVDEAQPLLADLIGVPNPDESDAVEEPDADDAARAAAVQTPSVVLPLPDHTTRAKERLAQLRRVS